MIGKGGPLCARAGNNSQSTTSNQADTLPTLGQFIVMFDRNHKITETKINFKGGGQEYPPHTITIR